ncbi:hypothetical protein, partial [Nocardia abscessus]|uniref:hypothetical protein n=1 Tax=Nocardia abscessus TaxID=120957 RepID=UPI002453A6E7
MDRPRNVWSCRSAAERDALLRGFGFSAASDRLRPRLAAESAGRDVAARGGGGGPPPGGGGPPPPGGRQRRRGGEITGDPGRRGH